MTMFVMTLGELNYADTFLPWEELQFPAAVNILFVLFVLGMPIILMNMLVSRCIGSNYNFLEFDWSINLYTKTFIPLY